MDFFRQIVTFCTSFQGYRTIRDQPFTVSAWYLGRLMAVLGLVLTVCLVPWVVGRVNEFADWVDRQFPPFSIQDGQVVTEVQQPYISGNDPFRFILDTTGEVTEPDPDSMQGILFMADRFLVWAKTTNTAEAIVRSTEGSLRGFPDGTVNGEYFRRLIRASLWVGVPLGFVVIVLTATVFSLLQAALFSLAASLMEQSLLGRLKFEQLLSIAIHAVTPASIIITVYLAMQLRGMMMWLIYLVAYGIFLVGGTNACREDREEED